MICITLGGGAVPTSPARTCRNPEPKPAINDSKAIERESVLSGDAAHRVQPLMPWSGTDLPDEFSGRGMLAVEGVDVDDCVTIPRSPDGSVDGSFAALTPVVCGKDVLRHLPNT